MLVLAVDTSGRKGSIALARCSAPANCELLEVVDLDGGTFSAQLIPQVATLLSQHRLTKADIDAFSIVSGPGSFTGLRIGLAAIKALGEILEKPIATVSLLELTAMGNKCLAAIDAGRAEVYVAEFGGETIGEERLLTTPEFVLAAQGWKVVAFDANIATAARRAGLTVEEIPRPRADAVARLGWQKIQARELTTPEELEANYIRRSDAEIFSASK
jgi:tRNA threonylcarbamoyladenosine biosynthesis protein TsaB